MNIPASNTGNTSFDPLLKNPAPFQEMGLFTIKVQEIIHFIKTLFQPCVLYKKLKVMIAQGLPQGGSLSTGLSNFYYARMTSLHLEDLPPPDAEGEIITIVDHFLFFVQISRKRKTIPIWHKQWNSGVQLPV